MLRLALSLVLSGAGPVPAPVAAQTPQIAAAELDTRVENPAWSVGQGPRVVVDEAHRNLHTADGRYRPFAELLRHDGYRVEPGREPFSAASLESCDVLVIANARGPEGEPAARAFTPEEVEAVGEWVEDGGALLLIADHAPFGSAARPLARRFEVGMLGGHLKDEEHADPVLPGPYVLVFSDENGLLVDHPVIRGRPDVEPSERVGRVIAFGGQALEPPREPGRDAEVVLRLGDGAVRVDDPQAETPEERPLGPGFAQMVALRTGSGRVVVLGEAGMLSAQVIRGEAAQRAMGVDEIRFGMTREDSDNRQLALNTMHWLSGLLEGDDALSDRPHPPAEHLSSGPSVGRVCRTQGGDHPGRSR